MNETHRPGRRGQSELIGTVLLIGLVLTGATTIVVLGASALNSAQGDTELQSAQLHLEELDARLATLSRADAAPRVSFDAGDSVAEQYQLERDGYINVTVDRNATCSFQQSFSSIVYEDSQERSVAYEAGGVWRGDGDGSTAISAPAVTFEDGTLDVRLVNVSGRIDQSTNEIGLNVTRSRNRSEAHSRALRQGTCVRPDNLTIWVKSRYTTGWRNYLEREIGVPPSRIDTFANGTVRVFVPQDFLHPSVDDNINNVVNLSHARPGITVPYMHDATLDGGAPTLSNPVTVMADKDAGNTYSAFVEPLTDDSLGIGREIDVEGVNVSGPPLDIVLVLDESGSMGSGSGSKFDDAQEGAKRFVGTLNDTKDRVSVVSYNPVARYRYADEMLFSADFDAVNDSIDESPDGGGTSINRGLDYMNAVFDLKSNQTRRRVAILLTDGKNTYGSDALTRDQAELASDRDITIYTIGYGSNADEGLMKDVAQETGGRYCFANNASAVQACFENFGDLIKPQNAIATTPITSNISTSLGQLFDADIPGDTSHIARVTAGSNTFLNVNDPTAPSLFSHSFAIEDNEDAYFNLTKYDCQPGAWNLTGRTRTVNGTTLTVARCTDIGPINETFEASIFIDGERPTGLLTTQYAGWQRDVNASLDKFETVTINASTGRLEAASNQALLVFDLPPQGSGTRNTLALLVQIGLSETQAAGENIVSVRVAEAEVVS